MFVIIEDETGDVQLVLWHRAFRENRRQLGSRVILAKGTVSRWYGTVSVAVSGVQGYAPGCHAPAHDWAVGNWELSLPRPPGD